MKLVNCLLLQQSFTVISTIGIAALGLLATKYLHVCTNTMVCDTGRGCSIRVYRL